MCFLRVKSRCSTSTAHSSYSLNAFVFNPTYDIPDTLHKDLAEKNRAKWLSCFFSFLSLLLIIMSFLTRLVG